MKNIFAIIFFCTITFFCNSQSSVTDIYTGKSYTKTQVYGYAIIVTGIAFIANGLISYPYAPESTVNQKSSLYLIGGGLIGGGITLVVIGKKKKRKKSDLNPVF